MQDTFIIFFFLFRPTRLFTLRSPPSSFHPGLQLSSPRGARDLLVVVLGQNEEKGDTRITHTTHRESRTKMNPKTDFNMYGIERIRTQPRGGAVAWKCVCVCVYVLLICNSFVSFPFPTKITFSTVRFKLFLNDSLLLCNVSLYSELSFMPE